jgi:hypothetical protein
VVENYSVAAKFGRMLMLADKQEDRFRRITVGADKTCDAKDLVVAERALNVTPHITKNKKGPPLEHRWRDDQAPRLRHQPELSLAGREGRSNFSKPSIVL